MPTLKNFRPLKYPREKLWDPQSIHKKEFQSHEIPTRKNSEPTKAQWPNSTRPTGLKMTQDPQNLALSV